MCTQLDNDKRFIKDLSIFTWGMFAGLWVTYYVVKILSWLGYI